MTEFPSALDDDRWNFDHVPISVLVVRMSDVRIIATNARFQKIFLGTADDFVGRDARDFVAKSDIHTVDETITTLRDSDDEFTQDNFRVFRRLNGDEFIGWVRAQRHTHPEHGVVAVSAVFEYYDPTVDALNFAEYVMFRNDMLRARIAAHFAHQLNNRLSALTSILERAEPTVDTIEAIRGELDGLTKFGKRLFRIGLQSAEAARFLETSVGSSDKEAPESIADTAILVVDDDPQFGKLFIGLLETTFTRVALAKNGSEALDALDGATYDVAIVDLSLGAEDGRDVAREIESKSPATKIVYMTGFAHASSILDAMGSSNHLRKPFELADVEREIRKVLST